MNKKALSSEFIFSCFRWLLQSYSSMRCPSQLSAQCIRALEEAILINENPAYVPERNLFVS